MSQVNPVCGRALIALYSRDVRSPLIERQSKHREFTRSSHIPEPWAYSLIRCGLNDGALEPKKGEPYLNMKTVLGSSDRLSIGRKTRRTSVGFLRQDRFGSAASTSVRTSKVIVVLTRLAADQSF